MSRKIFVEIVRNTDNKYYANVILNNEKLEGLSKNIDYNTLKKEIQEKTGFEILPLKALRFVKKYNDKEYTYFCNFTNNKEEMLKYVEHFNNTNKLKRDLDTIKNIIEQDIEKNLDNIIQEVKDKENTNKRKLFIGIVRNTDNTYYANAILNNKKIEGLSENVNYNTLKKEIIEKTKFEIIPLRGLRFTKSYNDKEYAYCNNYTNNKEEILKDIEQFTKTNSKTINYRLKEDLCITKCILDKEIENNLDNIIQNARDKIDGVDMIERAKIDLAKER